jgi:hypothetical protein
MYEKLLFDHLIGERAGVGGKAGKLRSRNDGSNPPALNRGCRLLLSVTAA